LRKSADFLIEPISPATIIFVQTGTLQDRIYPFADLRDKYIGVNRLALLVDQIEWYAMVETKTTYCRG
jgi:hypothetical protein